MIGGRMLDGAARHLINEFFRRFSRSLGSRKSTPRPAGWQSRLANLFGAKR